MKRPAQASLKMYDGTGREPATDILAEEIDDVAAVIAELEEEMQEAADKLDFERAALLRDQVNTLKSGDYRKPTKSVSYRQPSKKARRS